MSTANWHDRPDFTSHTGRSTLAQRARAGLTVAGLVLAACAGIHTVARHNLGAQHFVTGYLLAAVIIFLACYNLRKRFPALPLGRSATWLQYHIYAGYLGIGLFALHLGPRIPDGWFERCLALCFVLTAGSGLYGLFISWRLPKKLAALRVEAIYEQIPARRQVIAAEAERIALESTRETTVLATVFEHTIAPFLHQSRDWRFFLSPTGRRRRQLVEELRALHRYLSESQRAQCQRLELLVCEKDDLDFHAATQGRLKAWLFVHIGLTVSLLLLGTFHGLLAHAFHGGQL